DTFYAPNNATLVVVGDFKPLELRRYVNQYFSEIPRHREPPPVRCTARLSPGIQRREVTDVHANLPAVLRIYRAPPHGDPDTRALELLNVILGQGERPRLNVAVVRRETTLGKAEELHHYDMFHASLGEINSDLERFLAVTAADIRRVGAKYLDPANAVVIVVKPAAGGGAQ